MIVLQVRRVRRVTGGDVRSYKCSVRGHLAAWGYMLYGFFGIQGGQRRVIRDLKRRFRLSNSLPRHIRLN